MTTADALAVLLRANVAGGLAVLLVLVSRTWVRRQFGAHLAYALWLIVPAAAAGSLWPAWGSPGWAGAVTSGAERVSIHDDLAGRLLAAWATGVVVCFILALTRQTRFMALVRAGKAGPALVGFVAPRIVTPSDYAVRFSDDQRRLIRAHELAHIERKDTQVGALALAAGWLCWFNPLAAVALAALRCDQELACDATVMAERPNARRAYAEAMLAAHPEMRSAVFGRHWLAGAQPLADRLEMLARPRPAQSRRDAGRAALAALCGLTAFGSWSAQNAAPIIASPRDVVSERPLLIELSPPDADTVARVYRSWPR